MRVQFNDGINDDQMFCGNNWTEAFENSNNTIFRNSSFVTNETFTVIFRSDSYRVFTLINVERKILLGKILFPSTSKCSCVTLNPAATDEGFRLKFHYDRPDITTTSSTQQPIDSCLLSGNAYQIGAVLIPSCPMNYKLTENTTNITCGIDGNWSALVPKCNVLVPKPLTK